MRTEESAGVGSVSNWNALDKGSLTRGRALAHDEQQTVDQCAAVRVGRFRVGGRRIGGRWHKDASVVGGVDGCGECELVGS